MNPDRWTAGRIPTLAVTVVAVLGAVYSYASIYAAAAEVFGEWLAIGFPLLVDALIGACSLYYVGTVRKGRPQQGYRWTAHAGIAATIALNALAAADWPEVPWHVVAPAVWGVLVELRAREALRDHRADHGQSRDRIPARLWLTAPLTSLRVWLWMARYAIPSHTVARASRGQYLAARQTLRLAAPGRGGRPVRRIVDRQLAMGSLPPAALITATGLHRSRDGEEPAGPVDVLRAALLAALGDKQAALGSGPTRAPRKGTPPALAEGRPKGKSTAPGKGRRGVSEGRTATDDDLITDLRAWTLILADRPSSRQVRTRYGIGDERARRLLRQLDNDTPARLSAVTAQEDSDDVA